MKLDDMLLELRTDFLDDLELPYLWDDASLIRFINDALSQANALTGLFSRTDTITLVPGQADYALAADVRGIDTAAFDKECPLHPATAQELTDKSSCCWRFQNGKPSSYLRKDRTLTFTPTPTEAAAVTVVAWIDPPVYQLGDDIPLSNVHDILYWAAYRAFMKPDEDTYDLKRALTMRGLFEGFFGKPKSQLMQKMGRELPANATLRVGRIA